MEESVFMRLCRSRQTCGRRSTVGENADVLEEIALTHGMKTLRMSAIDYALRGITTVEEVQRVAYDDEDD